MEKIIQLEGLSCPSCVKKIEKGVSHIDGVSHVEVRFNSSKVNVVYDEHRTSLEQIKKRIADVGFKVVG